MKEVQTLEERVPVNNTVNQPNFTGAMTNLASSPSLVGQLGAQVAGAATMKLMEEKGLQLGKNPQGNLPILPINDYLKQLDSSYRLQSKATLSLQAQSAVNKANELMANKPLLSSGDIQQYQESMQDTLDDISSMAPTGVKEQLKNSFDATIQNNTHQYVLKMDAQQRKIALERQQDYIIDETNKMQESARNLNLSEAKEHKDNAIAQLSQRLIEGGMSAPEKRAEETKLNILIKQSEMIGEAMVAQENKGDDGVEKYLASMQDRKPDDMTHADYAVVMDGVYKAVAQREQYKSRNRNLIISEAVSNTVATGLPPNTEQAENMRRELTPQQFNEAMLRINSVLQKNQRNQNASDSLYNNRASAKAWTLAGGKEQKETFYRMVQDELNSAKQKNNQLTEVQAMTNVARSIPMPTKIYTDILAQKIGTGAGADAIEAAFAYIQMADGDPQDAARVSGLDDKAKVAASYMSLLSGGSPDAANIKYTPDEIASMAREAAYGQTDIKVLNQAYGEYYNQNLATKGKMDKFASEIIDAKDLAIASPMMPINNEIKSIHQKFFMLSKGNDAVSKQLTKDYFHRFYGVSRINGTPEYVINPAERLISNVSASAPLIQEDIINQMNAQFKDNNDAYMKGGSDIYYDVVTPLTKSGEPLNYDTLYKKLAAENASGGDEAGRKAVNDYAKYEKEFFSPRPIKVNVTRRGNEAELMDLIVTPSKAMILSEDHTHVGGYDVALKTKNGILISFESVLPNNIRRIHYESNVEAIRQMAGSIPNIQYSAGQEQYNAAKKADIWAQTIAKRGVF